ncbi:hypothetical protein BU15DRAFT_66846 [Melanogaster broomeanus]|nr:hypothetical protein BU15DRAFT_66846 [Melanogaster broomeanus]
MVHFQVLLDVLYYESAGEPCGHGNSTTAAPQVFASTFLTENEDLVRMSMLLHTTLVEPTCGRSHHYRSICQMQRSTPLFYVTVHAAIGLGIALVNITSTRLRLYTFSEGVELGWPSVTFSLATFAVAIITIDADETGFGSVVDFPVILIYLVVGGSDDLLALVWLRTSCDIVAGSLIRPTMSRYGRPVGSLPNIDSLAICMATSMAHEDGCPSTLLENQIWQWDCQSLYHEYISVLECSRARSENTSLPREPQPSASPAVHLRTNKEHIVSDGLTDTALGNKMTITSEQLTTPTSMARARNFSVKDVFLSGYEGRYTSGPH